MKYLKTFENHSVTERSFRDNLYNVSTILTGRPKTWEINRDKAEDLTKKVVDILIDRGYKLNNEAGIMTDGDDIWAIQDQGMQPIVITPKYDDYNRKEVSKILVGFYFPTQHKGTEEIVEINENDLEGTADNVAEAIDKLKDLGHRGNIFSKQGSIRIGLED
jgi:hypothetical protein